MLLYKITTAIAAYTGNLCMLCVEYICDTYNASCGLNLQTDSRYIADYKVVENLRQAGPNVISEVTHEFIGYFFPSRSIPHLARARFPLSPSLRYHVYFHLLCQRDLLAVTCADLVMLSRIFQTSSFSSL